MALAAPSLAEPRAATPTRPRASARAPVPALALPQRSGPPSARGPAPAPAPAPARAAPAPPTAVFATATFGAATANFGTAPGAGPGAGPASPTSTASSLPTLPGSRRPSLGAASATPPPGPPPPGPPPPGGEVLVASPAASGRQGSRPASAGRVSHDGASNSETESAVSEEEFSQHQKSDDSELKLGLGCLACILVLLEGIIVVYNVCQVNLFHVFDMKDRSMNHPFSPAQLVFLQVLGIGDLVLACIGAFGLWSCRNVLLALLFESLRSMHAQIATNCLKALLFWRIVVAILAAPFLGISMAFTPTHMTWHYCLAFAYLAASMSVAIALGCALGVVTEESRAVQLEFDLEAASLRRRLGDDLDGGKEPLVLGKLPWGPLVFLWVAVIGIACFVWSVRLWMTSRTIIGGWAVMLNSLSFVPSTHWLEMFVYNLSWVMAIVGISGIMMFNSSLGLEALVRETLLEPQENPLVRRDLVWELERAMAGKWQGALALQAFLICSLLRIAFFFPITGMALFEKNICGFYVTTLSRNYSTITKSRSTPLFCSVADTRGLVWLGVFFVLDLYLTSGVYKVWRHYRFKCALPIDKMISFNHGPSYGSADTGEAPEPPAASPPAASPPPSSRRRPPSEPPQEAPPAPAEEAEPEDALCPGIPPLPANFVFPLESFRKLSAGVCPVPILSAAGDALLHARLPSTPVQGYAVGGHGAWLELCATETARLPQASIGPLPRGVRKRRAAEIRGRAGESYGELTPVQSGWEVQRRGRTLLKVSSVSLGRMEISASLPDGSVIATAVASDAEYLGLYVDAGNDTLLVLLCVLAVILMSPRPPMLLSRSAPAISSLTAGQ